MFVFWVVVKTGGELYVSPVSDAFIYNAFDLNWKEDKAIKDG